MHVYIQIPFLDRNTQTEVYGIYGGFRKSFNYAFSYYMGNIIRVLDMSLLCTCILSLFPLILFSDFLCVGDWPWKDTSKFDAKIPNHEFDNFRYYLTPTFSSICIHPLSLMLICSPQSL